MRGHLYRIAAVLSAAALLSAGQGPTIAANAAGKQQEVDTIVLENEVSDEEVAVDLGWKTEQDKGQWIEDLGIAGDCNSLVLVINNLPQDTEKIPDAESLYSKKRQSRRTVTGNSRLYYFDKAEDGQWKEVFSINCAVSGGNDETEEIYGAYRPANAFGSLENPGSLVSYRKIAEDDYLIIDPDSDDYGSILKKACIAKDTPENLTVRLEEMKAFSNYGMILRPEDDSDGYPAIVLNCQQANTVDDTFGGVQLSESYVRMLIQSIDTNTRFMIAGEVEELEGM